MTNKLRFILLLSMFVMAEYSKAQDSNFWIFLCFGQSNMAGSAPIEKQDSVVPEGFLSMSAVNGTDGRRIGEWRRAIPPLCRQDSHLSPVDYFGREVLKRAPKGTRIGVVHVAVEGCPIDFFDKDGYSKAMENEKRDWMNNILNQYDRNPYKRLVDMARLAQKEGVVKGILLHQGETDAYNADWQRKVHKIYKDLQQDLGLDSFSVPMLVGEVVRSEYNGVCANANKTIDDIVNHYHNIYVVSSEGCLPGADNVHFSSEGYRELGRRYAERFMDRQMERPMSGHSESKETSVIGSTLAIEASLDEQGNLVATANEPLVQVDIVSYSGNTIKTITVDSQAEVTVNMAELPDETLVFVFKSVSGETNTLQLSSE